MKCPICGNEELQHHHRFCCNCGCRLDKKPPEDVQTEASILQNICPQTTTQEKTATAGDQPFTEEKLGLPAGGLGGRPIHTVDEGDAVAGRSETNVFIEPLQQALTPRAPNVGSEEPGKISLSSDAGGDARETTRAANSDLSEHPTRLDYCEKAENKFKSEVTAEGISPLETSETEKDSPSGDAQTEEGGEQTLAVKASSENGIKETKIFEASATAVDISTEEELIVDRPDEKTASEVDDAANDSDKERDLQQPAEENDSLKQGSNQGITPEQRQSGNEKSTSSVGGGNRNDAKSGDTEENKQSLETRGNVTPPPQTGAEETATQECQEKKSMHVDGSVSAPPNANNERPVQSATETKDDSDFNDGKKDLDQPSGNQKGTTSPVDDENKSGAASSDAQLNGAVTPLSESVANKTVIDEREDKLGVPVDPSVPGIGAGTRPNTKSESPVQAPVETKDDAHVNNGKEDLSQQSENQSGNLTADNKDKSKVPPNSASHPSGTGSESGKVHTASGSSAHQNDMSQTTANSSRTTVHDTGGKTVEGNLITVIFHALLTPTFSVNFKQGDKVFLRGGAPFSWNATRQIEMGSVREVSSGYYLLEGKTELSMQQAHRNIPYKYVVVRAKKNELWECLIGFKPVVYGHVNRCLSIPESSIKGNATWNQYDDAVFSQPSLWESFCSNISLFRNNAQDPAAEGRRMAMLAMLPDWGRVSTEEGGMNAHTVLTEIDKVVYCMSRAEFENGGYQFPRTPGGFDVFEVLHYYLSPRLNVNARSLQVQADEEESQMNMRLITSVIIASLVLHHSMTFLRDDEVRDLLRCLALHGDPERKTCSGFEAILRHFSKEEHLKTLTSRLFNLCGYVIAHRSGISDWLFAVPLLHFLSRTAVPFSSGHLSILQPSQVTDDSWWGTQGMDFRSVRQRAAASSTSTPAHLFLQLTPLFDVDPLFKRTFLLTLPVRDIATILQRKMFSLHEVCWTLARVVEERDIPCLSDEEWDSLEDCFREMHNELCAYDRLKESQSEEMASIAQAASQLLRHLLTAHGLVIRKRILVLSAIFQLLSKSVFHAKRSSLLMLTDCDSKPAKASQSKDETFNRLFHEAVDSLVVCLESHFTGDLFNKSEAWRQEEVQVWSNLLSVKIDDHELQLFWDKETRKALTSRIQQIDKKHVIELYCKLDLGSYHQEIDECLMSAAFEALETHVEVEIKEEHIASLGSRLELSNSWQDSGVGELFARLLKRDWPKRTNGDELSQDEVLEHVLSWKPMAQYLKYFGYQIQGRATLPWSGMELIVSASSLLGDLKLRLTNGEIDINTLRILQTNRSSFLNLCSLLSEDDVSAEPTVKSEACKLTENKQGTSSTGLFLDMRIEELEAFEEERDAVDSLVEMCSLEKSVDVDLDEVKEKLRMNVSSCQVLELCHKRSNGQEPMVKFFDLSAKCKWMIQVLHSIRASFLFRSFWHKCLQKAADLCKEDLGSDGRLTMEKVQELVWTPSQRRWRDLWERIINGEISLKEVNERFFRFRDDNKSLDVETEVAMTCFPGEEDTGAALRNHVDQIKQCFKLRECKDAAEVISDFQKTMGLKGDFQVLDDFQEQMIDTFNRQSLDTVSDDVLKLGRDLANLKQPQIKCLKTVIQCKDYIFWLREEVKGREEVKTLVDLAMMSAGESDIETDRVSYLHTTALGFAPFIFDLCEDDGFSELMKICEGVWEEIKENDSLPKKLEGICEHLEWLKGVKDAHAISSLKLAKKINEEGVYCIGQLGMTKLQPYEKKTVDSVVNLLLPSTTNGEATFREYSLEKLRELQSKLALISGKQSSSGQDDVDKFGQILQAAIQLGQSYVNLCEIGDVSHLEWNREYQCKRLTLRSDVISDMETQSKEFQRQYEACKEHINSQRIKYPELNYFTTQQLLFLRKELAALRRNAAMNNLNPQIYSLLEKVHPGIHQSSLKDFLQEAGIMSQNDDYEYEDSDQVPVPDGQDVGDHGTTDEENVKIAEKYDTLLDNVEKLGFPETERLVVAALVAKWESSDTDLVIWCVMNKNNDDLIDELYNEAKQNPIFREIINEDLPQPSQDSCSDDDNTSLSGDSEGEESDSNTSQKNTWDESGNGAFLSLGEISVFLSRLASNGDANVTGRKFPSYLKKGKPNLIMAREEHIFAAVLGLYMGDGNQSLPNSDEVLICTAETTAEEVELLWRRALAETGEKMYCLVRADLLDYDVSQKAVDCLHTLIRDSPNHEGLALVILCSSENEERAHIVASLEEYKKAGIPRYPQPDELRRYLEIQFKAPQEREGFYHEDFVAWRAAAEVGRAENLNVRVVASSEPGVGKSLVVQRLTEQVQNLPNNQFISEEMEKQDQESPPLCVTIPFHDKFAHVSDAVGFFLPHAIQSDVLLSRVFHLDCSCTVTQDLDTLLFNLLILGELTDDRGRIWRKNPYDLYVLEITIPLSQDREQRPTHYRFLNLLPSFTCLSPKETLLQLKRKASREGSRLFDEDEFSCEAVQRVWQYLRRFNEDPRQIKEFYFDSAHVEGSPTECLKALIRNCGVRNPSWSEIRYFVNFLNYQLRDCEQSVYCNPEFIGDTLEGFRTFVVAFMIIMSKDFSMRSLKGEEGALAEEESEDDIRPYQLRRRWEKSIHPYIFFNPDHETLTFLGFRVDLDGNLLDPQTGETIGEQLMSRHLRTGLHVQKVDLNNDFESCSKADKIQRLCSVMGIEWEHDPDETYELTGDNVKKILAIYMRFRCGIPVIIMGETGCGKTRLIRYMCGLQTGGVQTGKNLLLMKIHGGTTLKDVERNVVRAEARAVQNAQRDIDTVLFFDEANTTEALGMIKEVTVDRRCNGRPLSSESNRLKFISACNPYRKHSEEMIQKLESAGLGYHVRAEETTERFGRIPLRHLVYRVHPLPESMRSLVWDFGSLEPDVEERYIRQIVGRYVLHEGRLPGDEMLVRAISGVLAASQRFMRNRKDECSFVSLRDVKRAMEVMVWFHKRYKQFSPLLKNDRNKEESSEDGSESEEEEELEVARPSPPIGLAQRVDELSMTQQEVSFIIPEDEADVFQSPEATINDDIDPITWSLILALGVCYHARLQQRHEYREAVAKAFAPPCLLPGGPDRIEREIFRCQQAVMSELKLGPNIACNEALRENVFMMVVCIELRIPLFVVGKPGSSKSLAKAVVADNMQGERSSSDLFKTFKQIQLVSHQCSPQSTPEGIEETFDQCSDLQRRKNAETGTDRFASVVVLDEVGLAEDSPKMPLKTLHPRLEDSDSKDDNVIETGDRFVRVAFIGLSNWALDPAKMNRGIMVSRNEPNENELEETARGICGHDPDITLLVEHLIKPLVSAYAHLYNKQKSLKRLQRGKKDEFFGLRDFYSLVKMVFHVAKEQKRFPNRQELEDAIKRNFSGLIEEGFNPVTIIINQLGFPTEYGQNGDEYLSLDSLNLIKASLDRNSAMGEGRYLLILTENFSALPRVKQLLLQEDAEEPYVIFGSSFPKDQLFTQVCRNINRVKICMETGRTVILLNLDNLYESLYDALNQYYVTFGGEKYVDLGLGSHRVKCRVHKEFRLIVIAEKDVVYNKFPIPLINRMEKHFLVISSGLTEAQKQVTKKLNIWVENFAEVFQQQHEKRRKFTKGDAFMGFHDDSVPAVVLQVCNELSDDGSKLADEEREFWEGKVLQCCQERLVQYATPDSVTRLRSSRLTSEANKWWTTYFRDQEHSSLANFLEKNLKDSGSALRVQISTHSRLLSERDIPMIADAAGLPERCVKCVTLQQFQTEQQFSNCIGRDFFAKLGGRESVLIIQCDSSDQTLDLVACSRHLVTEECREMEKELGDDNIGFSHILMIVQLARVAGGCPGFISVHGEGWLSVHIDELCPPSEEIPPIHALTGRSVSTIFESVLNRTEDKITVRQILTSCVQEAASRIEDDETTLGRATKRVEMLLKLLSPDQEDRGRFEKALARRLLPLLEEKDQRSKNEGNEWLQTEALSGTAHETGTFKKALWRRFQSVVAPILAEVIAYVDRDGNLELADSNDPWVVELWLKILEDHSLTELQYADFILDEGDASVVRSKVPVLKSGCRSHSFQCKFPFSWLIKERMDELLRDARSVAASADSPESETGCFRRLLDNSEMKAVLLDAISVGGEAVVDRYLHDFTHMAYEPQDEDELEIIKRAITAAAKEIHNSEKLGGRFEMDLALVHTAHFLIRHRLNCLSLLLQAKPDVLQELLNAFSWDEDEMTVDAIALQMCLERMEPNVEDFEGAPRRREWCDLVLSLTVPVETIIGKEVSEDNKTGKILTHCRYMWQRLSAVRMFIEHVYPSADESHPEDVQQMLRLWKALGDRTDFSKTDSLNVIERFLLRCSEDSIQRLQGDEAGDEHLKFIQRCNAFFMALVSVFCFGEDIRHLDPDVFDMLMRFVTGTGEAETKQFSPFPGFGKDSSPVVRSFLLQQLISSSDEKAKKHLERFLYEAQGLSSEVPHILNVCLLTVQCMENSWAGLYPKNSDLDLHVSIGVVERLCQQALPVLEEEFTSSDELQVTSLEAIAKARYSLDMAAEFMYKSVVSSGEESWNSPQTRGALDSLFSTVNALFASDPSSSSTLYLLKQLVKRYGVYSIALISQNEELSWIVPDEFQRRIDDGMQLDRFLVYGELYRKVRDSLAGAILSEDMDELIAVLEALSEIPRHVRDVILLLALYREVTVPRRMAQNQKLHLRKNIMIKDVIMTCRRFLSPSAHPLANTFLETPQGAEFLFLPIDDSQSETRMALTEALIHATLVFQCIDFDWLLEPLHAILINPAQILDSYFPTMPEDSFHEARSAMTEGGQWYECPSRHRYFVGDCGRPDQQRDCPECHEAVAIGGLSHNLVPENRPASRDDRSSKRHILGAPQKSVAERDLSPARVSLLRIILHSAMLAGGCRQPEIVRQLIVPEVQADGVRDFLWDHLVNDVENLSTSLERSEDEVLLAVHFVLSEIVCRAINRLHDSGSASAWSTKEGRKKWEQEFWNVFVDPFWKEFEERLQNFYVMSVNDRRLGSDPLMQQVYEVDPIPPPRTAADIHPGHAAFWRYRTRVTVDHVIRQFQDRRSSLTACKMLGKFIDEESKLRAMCYLPDIIALQKMLTDRFSRRIDRERANQLKIREFLQGLPKGQNDNASRLFRSFRSAWDLVHHHLSSQGRFAPTKEECAGTISQASPVSVLLPASKGPGVCCKGLTFFLANVQNELVQTYRNSVGSRISARSTATVPLSEVSMSQLIAYDSEKDLLPVMLANCSYSLELGKETLLEYNWEALEKQICDRFVRGKPEVETEVEDFMFREDARSDESFAALENKIPQELIPSPIRVQILSELKDLRDVSDVISTLEITISFLSTAGGSPEMKISDYCTSVLRLSHETARLKSKKAQQFCCLNHVLDLWRTLALARAKLLYNNKQDPFHEVPDCFNTEMPRPLITHFCKALRKMDVEFFLSKLVEVIVLRLSQGGKGAEEMSLKEYLSYDVTDEDLPGLEEIPDDLCVKHVIYAWQLALEDSERDRGRRRSMMS